MSERLSAAAPESTSESGVSRRTMLKLFGVGLAGGVLGYSRFTKPQPSTFQTNAASSVSDPTGLVLPRSLTMPKRVVVIGAGLAGLSSAYELSQRGFQVTLLERAPQIGGKIMNWQVQVGDETFTMEHGFHGFFPQYYNLNQLIEELSITEQFQSLNFYSVVYHDRYQPEVFYPSHSAFPWNVVDLAISSSNRLRWGLNLLKPAHWEVFREITAFSPTATYRRLDDLSVAEWAKEDFPQGLFDLYFLPFAKSSLNAPDRLSAAELMQFFHFYFFGNPEGLAFRGTRQDMVTSLAQPIADAIIAKEGQVLTDVAVKDFIYDGDRLAQIRYVQGASHQIEPFWVTENVVLNSESTAAEYYGAADEIYRVASDRKRATCLTCPHQGCSVEATETGDYVCPCHGSVFDSSGAVKSGPAERDLEQFNVLKNEDDRLQLLAVNAATAEQNLQTLAADYYVIAADVPGTRQLLSQVSGTVPPELLEQVNSLAVSDPFAVARFWFDRTFPWEHSDFTSLSGYRLTDSITLYHKIQAEYIAWAERTGGSVVELHAYCYKEAEFPTQQALLETFEQELYEVVPELADATLLHRELVNQKNFSGYPPGSDALRPTTTTAIDNLYFAGDWVKMPFPCGLMERAVSSGFLAANAVLSQESLQSRSLYTVRPNGVMSFLA